MRWRRVKDGLHSDMGSSLQSNVTVSRKTGTRRRKRGRVAAGKPGQSGRDVAAGNAPVAARLPVAPLCRVVPDRDVLALFLVAKVLVVTAMLVAFYSFEHLRDVNLWNRWHSGADVLDALYLPFANWDGQHYVLLAERGYAGHPHSHAFFPLYPWLISAVQLIPGDAYLAAFALNLLLSFLFCCIFHRYAGHFLPARGATRALALLLCWPSAFYLSVLYSEALFLLLLFGFLYCYDLRKSHFSLLFALLLPLARGQAAFIPAALAIALLVRRLRGGPIDYRYEMCNLAAFALGGLLYLGFFHLATGNAFSGINAQGSFVFGNSLANVFNPAHFLAYLFSMPRGLFSPVHGLLDKLFIIAMLAGSAVVARSKNILWLALYILLVYPVAAMGAGGSFIRFSLIAAPFLLLALMARYARHKRIIYSFGAASCALQAVCAGRFALNLWVA